MHHEHDQLHWHIWHSHRSDCYRWATRHCGGKGSSLLNEWSVKWHNVCFHFVYLLIDLMHFYVNFHWWSLMSSVSRSFAKPVLQEVSGNSLWDWCRKRWRRCLWSESYLKSKARADSTCCRLMSAYVLSDLHIVTFLYLIASGLSSQLCQLIMCNHHYHIGRSKISSYKAS